MVPFSGKGAPEHEYPVLNSAFITFNRQISAHIASQALIHHEPYRMSEYRSYPAVVVNLTSSQATATLKSLLVTSSGPILA